jgi:hypothetical protein
MTFAASETGLLTGVPYELHEFRLGETSTYWRYADGTVSDIVDSGNTFTACHCEGGPIKKGDNAIKSQTTVKVDWENPFAWLYTYDRPEAIVHYTRYKGHGADIATLFTGDVFDVLFKQQSRAGDRWAEIVIDPSTACLRHSGLLLRYGRQCCVDLYSPECGVDPDAFEETGTLDAVDGLTLTSTVFGLQADGYWLGGKIEIAGRLRSIRAHSGDDIRISRALPGLAAGLAFRIWPGCTYLIDVCDDRFANKDDFRGQPLLPDEDPTAPTAVTTQAAY